MAAKWQMAVCKTRAGLKAAQATAQKGVKTKATKVLRRAGVGASLGAKTVAKRRAYVDVGPEIAAMRNTLHFVFVGEEDALADGQVA